MWRIRFLLPWFDCKHVKIWRGQRIQWKLFAKTRRRLNIKGFVWTDTEKNSKGNSSRFPRHVFSWTFVSQSIYTVFILLLYFFSDFILTFFFLTCVKVVHISLLVNASISESMYTQTDRQTDRQETGVVKWPDVICTVFLISSQLPAYNLLGNQHLKFEKKYL